MKIANKLYTTVNANNVAHLMLTDMEALVAKFNPVAARALVPDALGKNVQNSDTYRICYRHLFDLAAALRAGVADGVSNVSNRLNVPYNYTY